jgi:hypothetical protein
MLLDWPFGAALVGVLTLFVLSVSMILGKLTRLDKLMGGGI